VNTVNDTVETFTGLSIRTKSFAGDVP